MDAPQDGLIAIVKRDCPTCVLTAPILAQIPGLTVYTQDDPDFPETVPTRIYDGELDTSHRLRVEIVPTLIRFQGGQEIDRTYGWDRTEWQRLTGQPDLGITLPAMRPGCGAKNLEPGILERLKIRHNETGIIARRIAIGSGEDEMEAMFDRGWSCSPPPTTSARWVRWRWPRCRRSCVT